MNIRKIAALGAALVLALTVGCAPIEQPRADGQVRVGISQCVYGAPLSGGNPNTLLFKNHQRIPVWWYYRSGQSPHVVNC